MLLVYDNQPGVFVRAYWRAPWRDHHYFPATGIAPRMGSYENLSAISRPPKPATTFRRSWSNDWAVQHPYATSAQSLATEGSAPADDQEDKQRNTWHHMRYGPHAHGAHRTHIH
jgi:hypothetical protein